MNQDAALRALEASPAFVYIFLFSKVNKQHPACGGSVVPTLSDWLTLNLPSHRQPPTQQQTGLLVCRL